MTSGNVVTLGHQYYVDASEADQGLAGNGKTIAAWLAVIGTSKRAELIFDHKTIADNTTSYTVSTAINMTSYPHIQFVFKPGAMIAGTANVTFSSAKAIKAASMQQIFTGSGTISFAASGTVYPEWWGIDGTADQTEINKACAALSAGGTVELLGSSYTIAAPITPATKTIFIISMATTITLANGSNCDMVTISVNDVVVIGGGKLSGNSANQVCSWPTTSSSGIRIEGSRVKIIDINIADCWWAGIVTEGLIAAHISDILIEKCDISDCNDNAIRVGNWNDRVKILYNYIHGNGVTDTGGNRRGLSTLQYVANLVIDGNTISGNYENGVYIWTDCSGVQIRNNYVWSNGHFGIETSSEGCIIDGNHVVANGGLTSDDGGIFPYSKNIVKGNFVAENDHHGIYVYEQTAVIVAENIVRNTKNSGAGIRFYDPTNCLAIGNIALDDQSPVTQGQGLYITESAGVTGTPFVGNISIGNTANYIYGVSEETPLVGNIHSAAGYELGARDRQTAYVATISATHTFDPALYRTMLLNGGAADRNVNPSGTFRAGADIWLKNTGSTDDLRFDSAGLNQALTPGQIGYFVYSGSAWVKMYLGS